MHISYTLPYHVLSLCFLVPDCIQVVFSEMFSQLYIHVVRLSMVLSFVVTLYSDFVRAVI